MSGVITAVAAVGTLAYNVYSGEKQAKAQKNAQNEATANAEKQASAADQAMNSANQKTPNASGILDAASQAGRAGISGTMLTGSSGIDTKNLALGKSTLLGM